MAIDPPLVSMETQSAFMAVGAAAVLLFAILRNRHDRAALLFAGLTFSFGVYSAGRGVGDLSPVPGDRLELLGLALIGALAPTVSASLTGRSALERRLFPLILITPFVVLLGIALESAARGPVHQLATVWACAGVGWAALLLVRPGSASRREDPSPDAVRLGYLATAHILVAIAGVADLVSWQLGAPRVASLLVPLLYLYAGYLHLARVRVADLRQLMGSTIALTVMALGLAGAFAAIRIWVGTRLDLFVFNAFVASFVLLLCYPRIREWIQHTMERYFVASKVELERRMQSLRKRLGHVLTLDELLKDLVATLEQTSRVRSSCVFLRNPPHLGFQLAASIGLPTRTRVNLIRDPVWIDALNEEEVLLYEELEKTAQEGRSEADRHRARSLGRTLHNLDAQLVLPLRAEADLVGFWTLSEASPRDPFSTSEVRLLREVADQIALCIEKSNTFERIRARDRLAALGEMAGGLAHEIRNPLATIRGALDVLEDPEADIGGEFREVMIQEIHRLDRVVGTFLDYARPGTRPSLLKDVGAFVTTCVGALERQGLNDNVFVSVKTEGDLPPITVDADQLERVIANLILNAYESMDERGVIRVTVRSGGSDPDWADAVEISIQDTGSGMDEETLERAFIPFFTTKDSGTGLGLAICEKLVRGQGGTIQLSSRPGGGTLVRVRLPRCAPAPDGTEDNP